MRTSRPLKLWSGADVSQHRKPTRTELENRISRLTNVVERDVERMRQAIPIIEEQKRELEKLRAEHEYLKSTLVPALRSELLDMENSRNEERARGERLRAENAELRHQNKWLQGELEWSKSKTAATLAERKAAG